MSIDNGDHEDVRRIQEYVRKKSTLLRERRFQELRTFLDETLGVGGEERHAEECEIIWAEGEQINALSQVIDRIKSDNYSIKHVILAARFSYRLQRSDTANFLNFDFVSKFGEESSIILIHFVYKSLNNIEPTEEEKEVARFML